MSSVPTSGSSCSAKLTAPAGEETCEAPAPVARRRIIVVAIIVLLLVAAFWLLPSRQWIIDAYHWIRRLDRREGFLVFVGVYAILSAVGLPTSPLNIGAGLLFGLLWGFLASMAGVMAACILCFVIARYIARDWVLKHLKCRPRFHAVVHGLRHESWQIILLARLNPVLPAAVASYCFGVTTIRFRTYLAASLVGNIPLCFMLAYLGSAGKLALGHGDTSTWQYIVYAAGLVATIALTVWVTRFTKRKLTSYELEAAQEAS